MNRAGIRPRRGLELLLGLVLPLLLASALAGGPSPRAETAPGDERPAAVLSPSPSAESANGILATPGTAGPIASPSAEADASGTSEPLPPLPTPLAKEITREGNVWRVPAPEIPMPSYPIVHRPFHDGEKLRFEFGWGGIPAAEAEISVSEYEEDGVRKVRVKAFAETLDWLKWIWRMNDTTESTFLWDTVSPLINVFYQREKGARIDTTLVFYPDEKVVRSVRTTEDGPVSRIFPYTVTYDPITAAMMLRSIDLKVGDEKMAEVISGKGRYIIRIKVTSLEKIKVKPGEFMAFRLDPIIVDVHKRKDEPKKLKTVTLWLSADERRIPLRIESEVFVGSVYGEWIE